MLFLLSVHVDRFLLLNNTTPQECVYERVMILIKFYMYINVQNTAFAFGRLIPIQIVGIWCFLPASSAWLLQKKENLFIPWHICFAEDKQFHGDVVVLATLEEGHK